MFNVGGPELLVIALVALIVLGPDKLPAFIRQAGQVLSEVRRISSGFQADVRGALEAAEREADEEEAADADGSTPDDTDGVAPDPDRARAIAQAELDDLLAAGDEGPADPPTEPSSDGPPDASTAA